MTIIIRKPKRSNYKFASNAFSTEDYYQTFQHYKDSKPSVVKESLFNALHTAVNTSIYNNLTQGNTIIFTNIGKFQMYKTPEDKVTIDLNHNIKHSKMINYIMTYKLYKQDQQAQRTGVKIYNQQYATCKFTPVKSNNMYLTKFRLQRRLLRDITSKLKQGTLDLLEYSRKHHLQEGIKV